jgi:hypothetical protein
MPRWKNSDLSDGYFGMAAIESPPFLPRDLWAGNFWEATEKLKPF